MHFPVTLQRARTPPPLYTHTPPSPWYYRSVGPGPPRALEVAPSPRLRRKPRAGLASCATAAHRAASSSSALLSTKASKGSRAPPAVSRAAGAVTPLPTGVAPGGSPRGGSTMGPACPAPPLGAGAPLTSTPLPLPPPAPAPAPTPALPGGGGGDTCRPRRGVVDAAGRSTRMPRRELFHVGRWPGGKGRRDLPDAGTPASAAAAAEAMSAATAAAAVALAPPAACPMPETLVRVLP
jgi:hypothetical protein